MEPAMFRVDKHSSSYLLSLCLVTFLCSCGRTENGNGRPVADIQEFQSVEGRCDVGCGQCLFGLDGTGCDLAIRWNGVAMFVDGSGIDDHGDAHAADGLCNKVSMADVFGEINDGRFISERIILIGAQD
jgi:hypothetical protein